jgi:hypothetical protein
MSVHEVERALGAVVDGGVVCPGGVIEIGRGPEGEQEPAEVLVEWRITEVWPGVGFLQPNNTARGVSHLCFFVNDIGLLQSPPYSSIAAVQIAHARVTVVGELEANISGAQISRAMDYP